MWRFQARSIGLAFDDEVVGVRGEAVDSTLSPDGVGECGEPFVGAAVGGNQDTARAVSFDEYLVDIAAFLGIHLVKAEIVDDEEIDGEELTHLWFMGVCEACMSEGFEHVVGGGSDDGVLSGACDVGDGVCEEGLAHTDGADNDRVVMSLDEAEGDELIKKVLIEGDFGRGIPPFEAKVGIEVCLLGTKGGGLGVAAGDLVREDEQEEILVRHLLLASEGQALGESVEKFGKLESAEHCLEV